MVPLLLLLFLSVTLMVPPMIFFKKVLAGLPANAPGSEYQLEQDFYPCWVMVICKNKYIRMVKNIFKGEQGTAELGTNTVLKQTNELCF